MFTFYPVTLFMYFIAETVIWKALYIDYLLVYHLSLPLEEELHEDGDFIGLVHRCFCRAWQPVDVSMNQ